MEILQKMKVSHYFGVLSIFFLSVLVRLPAFFQERGPYIFCDEQGYPIEALRMFELGTWITHEFKAGGLNVYTILPFLHLADLLGITPNPNSVVDIARTIQPIIIGGSTSVLIYLSSKKIFKSEIYGYLSAILFAISPGVYAYSRFAYPDHYVYFFSAAVMYFLIRYLDNQLRKDLVLAAVFD